MLPICSASRYTLRKVRAGVGLRREEETGDAQVIGKAWQTLLKEMPRKFRFAVRLLCNTLD